MLQLLSERMSSPESLHKKDEQICLLVPAVVVPAVVVPAVVVRAKT